MSSSPCEMSALLNTTFPAPTGNSSAAMMAVQEGQQSSFFGDILVLIWIVGIAALGLIAIIGIITYNWRRSKTKVNMMKDFAWIITSAASRSPTMSDDDHTIELGIDNKKVRKETDSIVIVTRPSVINPPDDQTGTAPDPNLPDFAQNTQSNESNV